MLVRGVGLAWVSNRVTAERTDGLLLVCLFFFFLSLALVSLRFRFFAPGMDERRRFLGVSSVSV